MKTVLLFILACRSPIQIQIPSLTWNLSQIPILIRTSNPILSLTLAKRL